MERRNIEKIIFIGNIIDKEICAENKSCSPAGNNWQSNFFKNLELVHKKKIINLSIIPLQVYPFSKKIFVNSFVKRNKDTSILLNYINIIFLKKISIFISTLSFLLKNKIKKNDIIIIYNLYTPVLFSTFILKKIFGIKIVVIVADLITENNLEYIGIKKKIYEIENSLQKKFIKKCDKIIAVNRLILEDFKITNGIVLEGGVDTKLEKKDNKIKNKGFKKIIYTGTLDKLNGIDFLLKSFLEIRNKNVELVIYGRGPLENLVKEFSDKDIRIKYRGFISQDKIMDILSGADLLVIPRLKSIRTLRYTFPSKLFEYMLSGTPVFMTKIPGLSQEYINNVYLCDTEDNIEFASELEKILEIPENERKDKGKIAQEYIYTQKNWRKSLENIYKFLLEK